MNLDAISGAVPFDPNGSLWPDSLISALPDSARPDVDAALVVLDRLNAVELLSPLTANEVVREISVRLEQAALAGEDIDLVTWAALAVKESDAANVALHAHRLAVYSTGQIVVAACLDAIPAALQFWSKRVKALAGEVDVLLKQGAQLNELDARRGSKLDVDRWSKLVCLLNEYDGIRDAFSEARFLLDRSDNQDRFELGSAFKNVYDWRDGGTFRNEIAISGHPLVAAVRLNWEPWCPARSEQLTNEQEAMKERRNGNPRIPASVRI